MEDNLTQKLQSVLENPELMRQIMSLANNFSEKSAQPPTGPPTVPDPAAVSMLQNISGLSQQASIDSNQRALLSALSPYLSTEKIQKLENAMRAARITQFATNFAGKAGFPFFKER